ncbi:MAG: hypothetical protein QOE22_563 [Candidatus Parcubacteria bacterium]|jgi:hypothetical protein|nr:hypothetical protein [Candidatus Parcubacteria bacterium]
MKKMNIVRALTEFGERQGQATIRAGEYIENLLITGGVITYGKEFIEVELPHASATLRADTKEIKCAPTSFIGGKINDKDALVSSLVPSRYLLTVPNINFNPRSDSLSRPNFYFAPALAVRKKDMPRILTAQKVEGTVYVRKMRHRLIQFLIGNRKSPEVVLFAHYDSIGPGAMDNASGTAVCISIALKHPEVLSKVLIVLDPNEELSYDSPTYWGHGYRVFEKRHPLLLRNAKRVIVVDSVGNGKPQIFRDSHTLNLAFPLKAVARLRGDVLTVGGDVEGMMEFYQSDTDVPSQLTEGFLEETEELVLKLVLSGYGRRNTR